MERLAYWNTTSGGWAQTSFRAKIDQRQPLSSRRLRVDSIQDASGLPRWRYQERGSEQCGRYKHFGAHSISRPKTCPTNPWLACKRRQWRRKTLQRRGRRWMRGSRGNIWTTVCSLWRHVCKGIASRVELSTRRWRNWALHIQMPARVSLICFLKNSLITFKSPTVCWGVMAIECFPKPHFVSAIVSQAMKQTRRLRRVVYHN